LLNSGASTFGFCEFLEKYAFFKTFRGLLVHREHVGYTLSRVKSLIPNFIQSEERGEGWRVNSFCFSSISVNSGYLSLVELDRIQHLE
jgi:hypothetical protein